MQNKKWESKYCGAISLLIFIMNICGIQCFAQLKTAAIFGRNAVFQQNQLLEGKYVITIHFFVNYNIVNWE